MKCKECGHEVDQTMNICPQCGAALEKEKSRNRKKSHLGLIIAIVLVAILGIGGIWYGIHLMSSPKNIMLTNFSKLAGQVVDAIDTSKNPITSLLVNEKNIAMEGDLELRLPSALELDFQTVGLKMNYVDHQEERRGQLGLVATVDQLELLSLDGLMDSSNFYFRLPDTMKHYYYTASEYVSLFKALDTSDYGVFADIFVETMKENIQDKDIKEEKVAITLNEKEESLKKYTYQLTTEKVKAIIKDYVEAVKKNDKAINVLVRVMATSKEKVMEELDNVLAEVDLLKEEATLDLSVYVRGMNEVVMTELSEKEGVLQYQESGSTSKLTFQMKAQDVSQEINFTIEKEDQNYMITGNFGEGVTLNGTATLKDGAEALDLTLAFGEDKVRLNLTGKMKVLENGSKYEENMSGTVTVTTQGASLDIGLAMDVVIQKGGEITADVTGAKDINLLTEEELLEFQQELMSSPIFELIMSSMGTPSYEF